MSEKNLPIEKKIEALYYADEAHCGSTTSLTGYARRARLETHGQSARDRKIR